MIGWQGTALKGSGAARCWKGSLRRGGAVFWRTAAIALTGVTLAVGIAGGVLIASGDGRGNAVAPAEDPGWDHVGTRARNGMSVIYLGDGWVLTANHVGAEDVRLAGVIYPVVEGSATRIVNDDSTSTDLLLYRIAGRPALPQLPRLRIARTAPQVGESVLMIGHGRDRGASVRRQREPGRWVEGWAWGPGSTLRWGTNRISETGTRVSMRQSVTWAIATVFEAPPNATRFEAQAVRGDSGGAVFARRSEAPGAASLSGQPTGPEWELAGVMFAVASNLHRKDDVSVFGNYTYIVDLAHYRDQILSIVDALEFAPPGVARQ